MVEEDFFLNLPTPKLKIQMKKAVCDHIDNLQETGTSLSEFKDRKGLTAKIAEHLREKKVGGWVDLKFQHHKQSEYKMYKNLADSVAYELRARTAPQEATRAGEVDDSHENSTGEGTQIPVENTPQPSELDD